MKHPNDTFTLLYFTQILYIILRVLDNPGGEKGKKKRNKEKEEPEKEGGKRRRRKKKNLVLVRETSRIRDYRDRHIRFGPLERPPVRVPSLSSKRESLS